MLCFKIKMEDRNSGTEVGFFILCLKIRTAMRWYGLEDMSHWVHAGFWTFIQGFYFLHLLHFASCTPIAQKYPHFLQRHPHAREAPRYVCATIDAASEGYGKKCLQQEDRKTKPSTSHLEWLNLRSRARSMGMGLRSIGSMSWTQSPRTRSSNRGYKDSGGRRGFRIWGRVRLSRAMFQG